MKKERVLFEFIITNGCNKRCEYCKLNFNDSFISDKTIINFTNFIKQESLKLKSIIINFFGGEPLLGKNIIKKVVNLLRDINNIKFMIGTNGLLIEKEFLEFSKQNNIHYYLSIDTDNGHKILEKEILKDYIKNIEVNFILNPNSIINSYSLYREVISYGFLNINIMPVFSTIKWTKETLIKLNNFIKFLDNHKNKDINIKKYTYFNGVTLDKQFILETNGNIYGDLDSLLWIQKQNQELGNSLIKSIEKNTFLFNIKSVDNIESLLKKYNLKKIVNLVFEIPKKQKLVKDYKIIDSIIKGNKD